MRPEALRGRNLRLLLAAGEPGFLVRAHGDHEAAERMRVRLADVEHAIENVDYRAANIRAGHVYVTSNVGAFGPGAMKIGLTRRLGPVDRVNELGDACRSGSMSTPCSSPATQSSAAARTFRGQGNRSLELPALRWRNARHGLPQDVPRYQDSYAGAIMVDGNWYCGSMPKTLIDASQRYREGEDADDENRSLTKSQRALRARQRLEQWLSAVEARAPYLFSPKGAQKPNGRRPWSCPAGATHPPLHALRKPNKLASGKVPLTIIRRPVEGPAKVCDNVTSAHFPAEAGGKFAQEYQYGSKEWREMYGHDRNSVESFNAYLKDGGTHALEDGFPSSPPWLRCPALPRHDDPRSTEPRQDPRFRRSEDRRRFRLRSRYRSAACQEAQAASQLATAARHLPAWPSKMEPNPHVDSGATSPIRSPARRSAPACLIAANGAGFRAISVHNPGPKLPSDASRSSQTRKAA